MSIEWPLRNVWMGVSVENQRFADARIPVLLDTPAAVRFVSAEPLLGPVNLRCVTDRTNVYGFGTDTTFDAIGSRIGSDYMHLDWVIVGGESGSLARPMDLAWVRSLRDQCAAAGVAYFGKQISGPRPGIPLPGDLGDQEFPCEVPRGSA
jgi:protein gp37